MGKGEMALWKIMHKLFPHKVVVYIFYSIDCVGNYQISNKLMKVNELFNYFFFMFKFSVINGKIL